MAGGSTGRKYKVPVLKEEKPSACLSVSFYGRSPSLKLWMEGWVDRQTDGWAKRQTVPPLPCLPFSSSALWSWMELNANDLTELKSSKRNQFLFFCWFVPIVLSLLCLLMPFYVLYFSAYYLFGITYSLTYYESSLFLFFFGSRARFFIRWLEKKILWKFSFQNFIR